MNAERKAVWVAALRSNEYKQGRSGLVTKIVESEDSDGNEDAVIQHCCLGVACDLAQKAGLPVRLDDVRGSVLCGYVYSTSRGEDYEAALLPPPVVEWLELESDNPQIPYNEFPEEVQDMFSPLYLRNGKLSLAELNDALVSFEQIADIIEKHL